MNDCVIKLIGEVVTTNTEGIQVRTKTKAAVFAQVTSVSSTEFHEAGRNGLKPEFRFTMFAHDYSGQKELTYNNQAYSIYRTYLKSTDQIELYVEAKGGTNED